MVSMNDKQIARLEAQLERLVENVFTSLFRKSVTAHDIAVKIARAMDTQLQPAQGDDVRPIAPDQYTISLNRAVCDHLMKTRPNLASLLSQHVLELATQTGYRLMIAPRVGIVPHDGLDTDDLLVEAVHSEEAQAGTALMQPVRVSPSLPAPNAYLVIGERTIPLTQSLINIGRSTDNHIVLEDQFVSRHHIQLRLRFGVYTLFDVESRSGTYVNNVLLNEHRLQSGDVIHIGRTQLVYMIDSGRVSLTTTDHVPPVTP